ncbi:MAG: complex I NDUFA9 subunit family protein [Pseudomonadota bacterium]
MTKTVTIFGGSGFVGRYIVRRLVAAGWSVRLAVRHPSNAAFLTETADSDAVVSIKASIVRDNDVRQALEGAEVVVNCVGTFDMRGSNNFVAIQNEGATRIARSAQDLGLSRMVHLSSIGADANSASLYSRTKAEGEAGVLQYMPDAVILRPSVIFGPEDAFFNRFATMAKFAPILPVVGANTRFQPVFVDDVAEAAAKGVTGDAPGGIYELGGPDVKSFGELMQIMLHQIGKRRPVIDIPMPLARVMAFGMDGVQTLTGGLIPAQITPDQVRSLQRDNVVADTARTFSDLGITPTPMSEILPGYL